MTTKTEVVVPFMDLPGLLAAHVDEMLQLVKRILEKGDFVNGEAVGAFERAFASYSDSEYCIGVANGTDALWLTLWAADLEPGSDVITSPNSFLATTEAILRAGLKPKYVDIDPDTWMMSTGTLDRAIDSSTAAVMPVHLWGYLPDMAPLIEICAKHGTMVVEDAAQAHGATYRGKKAGSFGVAAGFSFYPAKNLGATGDAGAVVTSSQTLAEKIRSLANHGSLERWVYTEAGWNSRLDTIHAALLHYRLGLLDQHNQLRRAAADFYREGLRDVKEIKFPKIGEGVEPIYHVMAAAAEDRDRLRDHLQQVGVETSIHYPFFLPAMPMYKGAEAGPEDFPMALELSKKLISLPMFPGITAVQLEQTIEGIRGFYSA